ncbi:MAG: glycosyltransferase [Gammaproteobacteria bacterium]|nr:MAG: glycosyltransferase [Gammaproteobacteria bacterium]
MILGINASRARSGGGKSHLIGIISNAEPEKHGINQIHVWSYRTLLNELPNKPWLVKHEAQKQDDSIFQQLLWERYKLPKLLKENSCSILLNVDAGTVCRFHPAITMSRDMLSYEPGEINRYKLFSKARLRLLLLRYVQNASLRAANGAVFLTRYAGKVIQESCGTLKQVAYIPHGVSDTFKKIKPQDWPHGKNRPIQCLYISPVSQFKHQWIVVKSIEELRNTGLDITLTLVGGGNATAIDILHKQLLLSDPNGKFVHLVGAEPQSKLPKHLAKADLFVFASSCENLPNTLLEAMAAGLPIACSNRGPMPEVLEDGGVYFDPENIKSIKDAILKLVSDENLRCSAARRAKEISNNYSWNTTATKTFEFIKKITDG